MNEHADEDARVHVPWTDAEVEALNWWQGRHDRHPFTCPADGTRGSERHSDRRILRADPDGWWCEFDGCLYHQTWAHNFMATISAEPWGGHFGSDVGSVS